MSTQLQRSYNTAKHSVGNRDLFVFHLLPIGPFGYLLGCSKDRNHIIGHCCTWFSRFRPKFPQRFPQRSSFASQKPTHRQITHKNGLGTIDEKEEKVKKGKKDKKQEARAQTQEYLYTPVRKVLAQRKVL